MNLLVSPDGWWRWDGATWASNLSPDGRWRWDGNAWQTVPLEHTESNSRTSTIVWLSAVLIFGGLLLGAAFALSAGVGPDQFIEVALVSIIIVGLPLGFIIVYRLGHLTGSLWVKGEVAIPGRLPEPILRRRAKGQFGDRLKSVNQQGDTVRIRTGTHRNSWGETIVIEFHDGAEGRNAQILSRSRIPFNVGNGGVNLDNFQAIASLLRPGAPPSAA